MAESIAQGKLTIQESYLNATVSSKENYANNDEEYQKMIEQEYSVNKDLKELPNSDLLNKMKEIRPLEQGGVVGISGYYFQMLVTIYYIVELLEDKWTFVSMEYHDDIVVGNDDNNIVRFIQVKNSKEKIKKVSDTDVYTRKNSRNTSWIDKLFENSRIFQGMQVTNQYELFCDYIISNTSGHGKVEVQHYYRDRNNDTYNWSTSEDDDLYMKLKQDCFNKKGDKINHEEQYGRSLKDLLSILKFTYMSNSSLFKDTVIKKISDFINSKLRDGGVGVTEANLNWLIGELISRCAHGDERYLLFLEKEEAEMVFYELQKKCVEESRIASQSHDSIVLIDNGIKAFIEELKNGDATNEFCEEIEKSLNNYREIILGTLDRDNSIENVINRFQKGRKIYTSRSEDVQPYVTEFLKSSFIMYLLFEKFSVSTEFEKLLIHAGIKSDNHSWITFYHAGVRSIKKAIKSMEEIVSEKSNLEETLKLILDKSPMHTIVHGQNLTASLTTIELSTNKIIESEIIRQQKKLTNVSKKVSVIPVININEAYADPDEYTSIDELIEKINEIWNKINN
jgi:hypothetical protein